MATGLAGRQAGRLRRPRGPEARDRQGPRVDLAAVLRALHAQRVGARAAEAASGRGGYYSDGALPVGSGRCPGLLGFPKEH